MRRDGLRLCFGSRWRALVVGAFVRCCISVGMVEGCCHRMRSIAMSGRTSKSEEICYSAFYVSFVSWSRYWARNTAGSR